MRHQLYMWTGNRALYLERHLFYAAEIRTRVLARFANIEAEARAFAEAEFERLGRGPDPYGHGDMSAIAEYAEQQGVGHYTLLDDLRKQTTLGALAGMYQQWEKDLRDFIERELRQSVDVAVAKQAAWAPLIFKVYDLLERFGWPVKTMPWYSKLDACRLVVNVYKHGKGDSFERLLATYPEYLRRPFDVEFEGPLFAPGYDSLDLTDEQFTAFDIAICAFWDDMPERLYFDGEIG